MTMPPEVEIPPTVNGAKARLVVRPASPRVATPIARRPKGVPDYRLRGLHFDAASVADVAERPARQSPHPSRRRRRRRIAMQWTVALVVVAVTAVGLRAAVVHPYSVTSTSMVPTLQPGMDVLVVKPAILTGGIDRGDIVVLHRPDGVLCPGVGDDRELVSRVIAMPGQTIWSEGENIIIDGVRLDEPHWQNPPFGALGNTPIVQTTVPANSYFVLGDNRTDTCDSRAFGPVAKSALEGEVVAITARGGHPFVHAV